MEGLKFLIDRPKMRKHLFLIVLGFAVGILFYAFHKFKGIPNVWEIFLNGALGVAISYIFDWTNLFLNRTIHWKRQTGLRLFMGIFVHLIAGLAIVFIALKLYGIFYPTYDFFASRGEMVFLKITVLFFCVVLIYNIIYFAYYSYQYYIKGQLMESQLQREQTELQLTALKSQLSPHFLFNCLNALSALVTKDVNAAEQFIRSLATSYQYTLKTYRIPLVEVAEELKFTRSYYFLMKTRFQGQISLDVDVPEPFLGSKIPPMTLQMLVENAIKHNVSDTENQLMIRIRYQAGFLEVANTITKPRLSAKSTHIGLHNIKSRYKLLIKKPITVQHGTSDFSVKLPVFQ